MITTEAKVIKSTELGFREKYLAYINFGVEEANGGFVSALFAFMSNLGGIGKILGIFGFILFPIAFGLKAANWLLSLLSYFFSKNRNLGKTADLIIKTIATVLVGFAIFGVTLVGASVAPFLFVAAFGLETLVSFGKTFYHFLRFTRRDISPTEKDYFKNKYKEHGIKTVVGIIAFAGIVIAMVLAPHIAGTIVAVAALAAGLTLLGATVFGLIKTVITHKKISNEPIKPLDGFNSFPYRFASENDKGILGFTEKEPSTDYYKNAFCCAESYKKNILSPLALAHQELTKRIDDCINVLKKKRNGIQQGNSFFKYFGGQLAKLKQKEDALSQLKCLISLENLEKIASQLKNKQKKTITAFGATFNHYTDVNDFLIQLNDHLLIIYPSIYQSFFKEVGEVERVFKEAFKMIAVAATGEWQSLDQQFENIVSPTSKKNK